MIVLKSAPGLVEKIVAIAGSTTRDGTVVAPHYGKRLVRASVAPAKRPAREERAVGDLFGAPAETKGASPEPAKSPKALPEKKPKRKTSVSPPKSVAEPVAETTPTLRLPEPKPAIDFDAPFDPSAVPDFGVPAGTSKEERRRLNAAAVAALKGADGGATVRDALKKYSGTGGVGDSLNEYYTDPKVAAAAWYVLRGLGLPEDAEVLEPSCATGVFFETAPSGVHVTGVELDPTSAEIGKKLHPRHEVQNASLERFATQDVRQFDAVIGNAPFGLRGSLIKDDKPGLKTAEAYFLDTAIDKTRGGGIVAMIVPTGVMDGKNNRGLRERLLRKAEFVGAVRMPNTAFEHSHTEVTTDLVFFRKRQEDVAQALTVVQRSALQSLGVWDDEFLAGEYFTGRGAANILGTQTEGWRAKAGMGNDITVEGSMAGVPDAIAAFKPEQRPTVDISVARILDVVGDNPEGMAAVVSATMRKPYDNAQSGDIKFIDGVEYILQGRPPRWHRVDEIMQTPAVTAANELAAEIERAINGDASEGLAERVRDYVEKFGIPAKNADLMLAASRDKSLYRLVGAVKPDGSLSDVVAQKQRVRESSFDSAAQALAVEVGDFTPEMIAARWSGGDSETALDHLYASPNYALNPDGLWTTTDAYLTGDLWQKVDDAKAAIAGDKLSTVDRAKLERQEKLLDETIDPKSLEDVEIMLNSAFLPLDVVAEFFNEKKRQMIADGSSWAAEQKDLALSFDKGIYALTGGLGDTNLLEKYLNRTGVRKDDLPQIDRWNAEFKDWLCASRFRDEIENLYNRTFKGFRQKAFSETPFEIPGLATDRALNGYQYSGLRWALAAKKGIIAADVGLGKTPRGLVLARLAQVSGQAKKPMIVVPKSVLINWVSEAEAWFPGARIMAIGETFARGGDGKMVGRADTAAERNRKYHDIRQNDYDFILISQPAFNDLDLDPETKANYANDDFWVQRGDALGNAGDKRINKIRESYNQYMAGREFQKRSDAVYFNDLGVDMIIGDEGHAYKNLYAARNRFGQTPKFLGGQGLSNRALDMNFKTRWVREHNAGDNVYLLTATPTKNSPLEVYSMLSHIAPEAFERIGIRNSEEFLDRFCEFKNENILNTRGEIEEALVTVGFKNLDELREIMRRYIDRKTAEEVGLVLPKRDDRMHAVDMTPQQNAVYAELRELAEQATTKKDATGDAHIFSIMDKMGKAAMDLELYDPSYKGATSPKYDAAATEISDGAKDGGQVVFADNIGVHQKMIDALVRKGMPRNQIAVINAQEADTSSKRQNVADDFNAGRLKVVIGNTATMGEGINLQKGTTDIHHMDLPWEPASVQQRNGRGLRQGNMKESVRIHTYLAKGSFDGYRYQCLLAKKNWQDILWNGGNRVENLAREGAMSREDMLVMLSADPEKARDAMVSNKALAEERFKAQKHSEAASEFVRFQEMKRSYNALKRKDGPSAHRLKVRMDRAKVALESDPFFTAKHALDSKNPVVIHPQTGTALEKGVAFEMPKVEGAINGGGRFVIESVSARGGEVRARAYGEVGAKPVTLGLEDLKTIKPFQYDEAAERAEISRAVAESAKSKLGEVKSPQELVGLPSSIIEEHYDALQGRIKTAFKEYSWGPRYGAKVAMIPHGGGAPVAVDGYEAKKKLDDHDIMLPTASNRAAAVAAYIADERAKDFRMETPTTSGRRGRQTSSAPRLKTVYPGGYGQSENQWKGAARDVFGETFEKDAHAAFESAQTAEARRAKSLPAAISALAPTVEVEYGGTVKWSKRALATLWAHAKRDGNLDETLESVIPRRGGEGWGADSPKYPKAMFSAAEKYHAGSAIDTTRMTVRDALTALAQASHHHDISAAMLTTAHNKFRATKTLFEMAVFDRKNAVGALSHLLAKNPELGDERLTALFDYMPPSVAGVLGADWRSYSVGTAVEKLADQENGDEPERLAA